MNRLVVLAFLAATTAACAEPEDPPRVNVSIYTRAKFLTVYPDGGKVPSANLLHVNSYADTARYSPLLRVSRRDRNVLDGNTTLLTRREEDPAWPVIRLLRTLPKNPADPWKPSEAMATSALGMSEISVEITTVDGRVRSGKPTFRLVSATTERSRVSDVVVAPGAVVTGTITLTYMPQTLHVKIVRKTVGTVIESDDRAPRRIKAMASQEYYFIWEGPPEPKRNVIERWKLVRDPHPSEMTYSQLWDYIRAKFWQLHEPLPPVTIGPVDPPLMFDFSEIRKGMSRRLGD